MSLLVSVLLVFSKGYDALSLLKPSSILKASPHLFSFSFKHSTLSTVRIFKINPLLINTIVSLSVQTVDAINAPTVDPIALSTIVEYLSTSYPTFLSPSLPTSLVDCNPVLCPSCNTSFIVPISSPT